MRFDAVKFPSAVLQAFYRNPNCKHVLQPCDTSKPRPSQGDCAGKNESENFQPDKRIPYLTFSVIFSVYISAFGFQITTRDRLSKFFTPCGVLLLQFYRSYSQLFT